MEKKNGAVEVKGLQAGAAHRLGIGEPVLGRGVICQGVPRSRIPEIMAEAMRMMKGKAPADIRSKPPVDRTKLTLKGTPRKRLLSNMNRSVPLVTKLLKESEGRISNSEIRRHLREEGVGLSTQTIGMLRQDLGLAGGYRRPHSRPLHISPEARGVTPKERAEKLGLVEPVQDVPAAPTEEHPLVPLIRKLAERFGIVAIHWEAGKELVIHESQERRFTV